MGASPAQANRSPESSTSQELDCRGNPSGIVPGVRGKELLHPQGDGQETRAEVGRGAAGRDTPYAGRKPERRRTPLLRQPEAEAEAVRPLARSRRGNTPCPWRLIDDGDEGKVRLPAGLTKRQPRSLRRDTEQSGRFRESEKHKNPGGSNKHQGFGSGACLLSKCAKGQASGTGEALRRVEGKEWTAPSPPPACQWPQSAEPVSVHRVIRVTHKETRRIRPGRRGSRPARRSSGSGHGHGLFRK